jgi:hypothetical protein
VRHRVPSLFNWTLKQGKPFPRFIKGCKLSYKKKFKVEYETGSYGVIVLTMHIQLCYTNVYVCTGCAGKNLPLFGRALLMIKQNDEEVVENDCSYTFMY